MANPRIRQTRYAGPLPTSALAIWSLVLGIIGFCGGVPALGGILCGHLARGRISDSAGRLGGGGLALAGLIVGYVALAAWAGFGWLMYQAYLTRETLAEEEAIAHVSVAVPVPEFPALPPFSTLESSRVRVCQLEMEATGEAPAGGGMSFRVYLPPGEDTAASLACVLVAPAGTNLLTGAGLDALDDFAYHNEALPYAEAGMAVVLYSLDGADPETASGDSEARVRESREAYLAFKAAGAGVVNGRNALEFVLQRLPMVDPERIFSAGHSSSGTLSLLLAAHEPRLRGSVAYAPAVDIEAHFSDLVGSTEAGILFPGLGRFARDSSPMTHAEKMTSPVFLFFAEDDEHITPDQARPFLTRLQTANADVAVKIVPRGGHYQSMIDVGIPAGIEWIKLQSL